MKIRAANKDMKKICWEDEIVKDGWMDGWLDGRGIEGFRDLGIGGVDNCLNIINAKK